MHLIKIFILLFFSLSALAFFYFYDPLFFSGVDRPSYPYKTGLIRDLKNSYDGYFINQCHIFKEGALIKSLPGKYCRFVPGGKVFSIVDGSLTLFSKELSVLWKKDILAHHDMDVDIKRSEVASLTSELTQEFGYMHGVRVYSFDGEELFHWNTVIGMDDILNTLDMTLPQLRSTFSAFDTNDYAQAFIKINSVGIIGENPLSDKLSFLKPGNVILNLNNERLFIILDRDSKKIVWSLLLKKHAHSAKILDNGNLLFFQNNTVEDIPDPWKQKVYSFYSPHRLKWDEQIQRYWWYYNDGQSELNSALSHSAIVEYSIEQEKDVWRYENPYFFYSPILGYVEKLPNGNYFVSHITHGGSVIEISPEKKIVWEWTNPEINKNVELPFEVYWTKKVPKDWVDPFLEESF